MSRLKATLNTWGFLICFASFAQDPSSALFFGANVGSAFHSESKASTYNGGGSDLLWQQIISDQTLFNGLMEALGGEPFELRGPESMSISPSFYYGLQSGYDLMKGISFGLYFPSNEFHFYRELQSFV